MPKDKVHADLEPGNYAGSPMFQEGVAYLEELHPGVAGPILEAAKKLSFREFWQLLADIMFHHGTPNSNGVSFLDMVHAKIKKHG